MSYPNQITLGKRLQDESHRQLRTLQETYWHRLERLWGSTRRELRSHIADVYRTRFGTGVWSVVGLKATGAGTEFVWGIKHLLSEFKQDSRAHARTSFNELFRQSLLRHSWILDQLTPPSFKIKIPHRQRLFEAGALNYFQGAEAEAQWASRWDAWVNAYENSLTSNLQLGAINQSGLMSAIDEVDATQAGTPSSGLLDAFARIFESEATWAIAQGANIVSDVNEEADVEEIWQTVHDGRVCDDCDPNDGLTMEEADGEIPNHPNCRCYWRLVPKTWAELLAGGSEEDRALAILMDAQGLVPNAMLIRDIDGKIAGSTIITFEQWAEDNNMAVAAK